ncbi:uncharacterized protein METZ01_LOCUS252490, partial [marine metagenome]
KVVIQLPCNNTTIRLKCCRATCQIGTSSGTTAPP